MGGYQPGNEGLLGWRAEVCEVVVAEVLAVGWQLVVLERGQDLLQLQEEALTGGVAFCRKAGFVMSEGGNQKLTSGRIGFSLLAAFVFTCFCHSTSFFSSSSSCSEKS